MFRKTWFWAAFSALAVAASLFAWWGFPRAFPLVSLDVSMTREQAIERALAIAEELNCGPSDPRAAARFGLDSRAQTFLELEGGGSGRVRELIATQLPTLHAWRVRLFAPNERSETEVSFTPDGRPWGFEETLAEEARGAALDVEEARALALSALELSPFELNLADWEDVERSREQRSSGRVDHAFTWRHREIVFGAAEYRLKLSVSGDRLTGVARWIEVPEAFDRRYLEMRSINETIAAGGSAGLSAFFLAGVGASLMVLMRQRRLLWKPAFAWGFFVGGLQALALLNSWPLAWFDHDTALSPLLFVGLQALQAVLAFLGTGLLLGLTFVAAEGLARRAFPDHPRLWSLWSRQAASSRTALGMTLAGYLLVGVFFAYEVALAFASSRWLGWWSPTGVLEDPDALATWWPSLDAIAGATQAGFWEEALFRAIPLALAALIGRQFGRERSFVIVALLLQALVFGAAHANYPAQPAHARLLELTIPAIGFGLVFLRFGLLTVVICHFVYDLIWMALPIYGSSADGAGLQAGFVTLFASLPLILVLVARLRTGRWGELGASLRNSSWLPPEPSRPEPSPVEATAALPAGLAWSLGAAGLVGVALFALAGDFDTDAPRLEIPRSEALERARGELESRGLVLGEDWLELSSVSLDRGLEDELAWRELGPEAYRDFLRDWSGEPEWTVRRVRVDGDVVARAEEWRVAVTASGHARVRHVLPEESSGPRLGEETARALALTELERRFGLLAVELEEVEATPERLPERSDWRFSFRVPSAWPGTTGEARVLVDIAGAETVNASRFVHVSEDWSRRERERELALTIPRLLGAGLLGLVVLAACLASLVAWPSGRTCKRTAALAFGLVALAGLLDAWNSWPSALAAFSTTRSWALQTGLAFGGLGALALTLGSVAALLAGFAEGWRREPAAAPWSRSLLCGAGLGALLAGALALRRASGESSSPTWGDYTAVGSRFPWLTELLGGLPALVLGAAVLILLVTALDVLTSGFRRRRALGLGLLAVLGGSAGLAAGAESAFALTSLALIGAGLAPLAWLALRRAPAAVPVLLATWLALGRVRSALQGVHPEQALGAALSGAILLALGLWWSRRLALRPPSWTGALLHGNVRVLAGEHEDET